MQRRRTDAGQGRSFARGLTDAPRCLASGVVSRPTHAEAAEQTPDLRLADSELS